MSLITCCPACGTMFKVVPDQLRISEGWVRCGHCSEVFDASAHLQVESPVLAAPPPPPEETLVAASSEPVSSLGPDSLPDSEFDRAAPAPRSAVAATASPELAEPALSQPQPSWREQDDESEDSRNGAELAGVSFVRQARREAAWHRPAVRAGLTLLVLVLGGLLAFQVAVQDRERLAAWEPQLRPWLEKMCEPLGCTVGPLRQIEAVVIDSSSFNKLRADAYRLSFTLKNQAATEIALPAMELTLTDTQDQPVLRRVLRPAEMGSASGVIGAASDWSASLVLGVANGGSGRITGYRLLAFYP